MTQSCFDSLVPYSHALGTHIQEPSGEGMNCPGSLVSQRGAARQTVCLVWTSAIERVKKSPPWHTCFSIYYTVLASKSLTLFGSHTNARKSEDCLALK